MLQLLLLLLDYTAVGFVAQRQKVGLWPANFLSCARPVADGWPLMWETVRYRSTNQDNSAFHPFGVDRWVVSCNWMSPISVTGDTIWWTLTKERHAWCVWVDCSNK